MAGSLPARPVLRMSTRSMRRALRARTTCAASSRTHKPLSLQRWRWHRTSTLKGASMTTGPVILCMNSGSSSLKFALYQLGEATETALATGAVERIGLPGGSLWLRAETTQARIDKASNFPDQQPAVHSAFVALEKLRLPVPEAVGHRLVHGGADHSAPERVDRRLLEHLRQLVPYAPLHLPAAIQDI